MSILPEDNYPKSGLLNDTQIRSAIESNFLISSDSADMKKVKYATYEMRVSNDYHIVKYIGGEPAFSMQSVEENQKITIEPGQTIKVLSKEVFRIPNNIYAKITTVGQIFSSGLAAENTYADPGYHGQIYITLSNITSRRLSIKPNDPLARVEFHKLESPVEKPHSGQNGIRKNFVTVESDGNVREILSSKSVEELIKDMINLSLDDAIQQRHTRSEILIEKAHNEITNLSQLKKSIKALRRFNTALFFVFILSTFLAYDIFSQFKLDGIIAFSLSVFSSILASLIFSKLQNRVL